MQMEIFLPFQWIFLKKQMPMDVPAFLKEKGKKQTPQFSKAGCISHTAEKPLKIAFKSFNMYCNTDFTPSVCSLTS